MEIWVLIPAYNEEKTVGEVVTKVLKKVNNVLVVDDGSTDNTADMARKAGATLVSHTQNQGKGQAKQTGFDWLLKKNFDVVITMDADGQHSPEDLPKFLKLWSRTKADIIIGNRMRDTRDMPYIRYLTNRFMSLTNSLIVGQRFEDTQCDYRLISRGVLEKIRIATARFEADVEFLFRAAQYGFRIISMPVRTIYIPGRQSKIRPLRDTFRYIRLCLKEIFRITR